MRFFTSICLFIVSTSLFAQSPAGTWLAVSPFFGNRPIGVVKITVNKGILCGSLVKILPVNGQMNFSRYGSGLPNSGLIVMCNYHQTSNGWEGGMIYEQKSAEIYGSSLKLDADGKHLYVTGQSGIASQTAIWRRLR